VTLSGIDGRIPIGTTDAKFIQLIMVFNQMLERSFSKASRLSGDVGDKSKYRGTTSFASFSRNVEIHGSFRSRFVD
jgi:hypothetical protein